MQQRYLYILAVLVLIPLFSTLSSAETAPTMKWNHTYNGTERDYVRSLDYSHDGGYFLFGSQGPQNGQQTDIWVLKTDSGGSLLWNKTYNLSKYDFLNAAHTTADGGFIMTGVTDGTLSSGDNSFVIKADAAGNVEWSKVIDFGGSDRAFDIQQTSDLGYIIALSSTANGYKAFLVKFNETGSILWNKSYAVEDGSSAVYSVAETIDNGFIFVGYTSSSGKSDIWMVRANSDGEMEWNRTFDYGVSESTVKVLEASDNG